MIELLNKYNVKVICNKEGQWFSADDVGEVLGIKNIRNAISRYRLKENGFCKLFNVKDFGWLSNRGSNFLNEEGVKIIISNSDKPVDREILDYFKVDKYKPKILRFEHCFSEQLKKSLEHMVEDGDWDYIIDQDKNTLIDSLEFVEQYPVGEYRLDFYFPLIGLVVEYDEEHHIGNKEKDIDRELKIGYLLEKERGEVYSNVSDYTEAIREQEGLISFVRVKKGQEMKGIVQIISKILKVLFIS